MDGSKLIVHSEKCSQDRFSMLAKDESMLRMERMAGFSTLVYTDDKDLIFALDVPAATPSDADRQQYIRNYQANLLAMHPELKITVTSEGTRLILHTPFAAKADYYKTDWTKARQMWVNLGFTEFLYTNDGKLSILSPIVATPRIEDQAEKTVVAPELAKVVEPFGFHKGMTRKDIVSAVGAGNIKQENDDRLVVTTAPRPNPMFESYLLLVSPNEGLLKVAAIGKNIDTGDSGMEVHSAFDDALKGVTQKYGKPTQVYDNCNGTGCDDLRYWMLSLLEKNRNLSAFWDLDFAKIMIEAKALRLDSGYVTFDLEFPGFEAYAQSKKEKQNDSF
jgi:hypothetical protein